MALARPIELYVTYGATGYVMYDATQHHSRPCPPCAPHRIGCLPAGQELQVFSQKHEGNQDRRGLEEQHRVVLLQLRQARAQRRAHGAGRVTPYPRAFPAIHQGIKPLGN